MRALSALIAVLGLLAVSTGPAHGANPPVMDLLRIESDALGEVRRINVYPPPRYDHCAQSRYPVLYLLDGGVSGDYSHVVSTVHRLIHQGHMSPVLVVGVSGLHSGSNPGAATLETPDASPAGADARAQRFRTFLRAELPGVIKARYRVTDASALMGGAHARASVVDAFTHEPGMFNAYVALNPSLAVASGRPASVPSELTRLFIATGSDEPVARNTQSFGNELRSLGSPELRVHFVERPELPYRDLYRAVKAEALKVVFPAGNSGSTCGDR